MQIRLADQDINVLRLQAERSLESLRDVAKPAVIAIGNFDGVHKGHQALIERAQTIAKARALDVAIMLFEPQPLEYFSAHPPIRLMRLEEKVRTMTDYGVHRFYVYRFDADLAHLSSDAFADRLQALGAKTIVVGADFRYGHHASGDVQTLTREGESRGFAVEVVEAVLYGETRVSSSRLRAALLDHDLQSAERLMGRPLIFWGRVGHGDKMGRQIGFPTINLVHKREKLPLHGVYSTWVSLADGRCLPGVCNIGNRPTVQGIEPRLEVYIIDFNEDLYGQKVKISIVGFVRGEKKFANLDELKAQISQDIQAARAQLSADSASMSG